MSKLISHGKVRLVSARSLYSRSKTEPDMSDYYIDMCCFDYQQSMEFLLKGIVELLGEKYVTNHDLRANLNKISSIQTDNPEIIGILKELGPTFDLIRQNASTFNEWETKSRYEETFTAVSKDIELADEICQKLDECSSKLYKTVPND